MATNMPIMIPVLLLRGGVEGGKDIGGIPPASGIDGVGGNPPASGLDGEPAVGYWL